MRKRFLAGILAVATFAVADIVNLDWKYIMDYGPHTSGTINTFLGKVPASTPVTAVLSGGPWTVTNNVTFPTNMTLIVTRGSWMNVSTTVNVSVLGDLIADDYQIFAGAGTATGPAIFPYRHPDWGDVVRFNVGTGYIETIINNVSNDLHQEILNVQNEITVISNMTVSVSNFYALLLTNAYVWRVTNDLTVAITTNDSKATVDALGAFYLWIDPGKTLTFDFADGAYTITTPYDNFDNVCGPGTVKVIGNELDKTAVTITQSNTNNPVFRIREGEKLDWINGFTLIGSATNGFWNSHAGVEVYGGSTVTIGNDMTIYGFNEGVVAYSGSHLGAEGKETGSGGLIRDCGIGAGCAYSSALTMQGWTITGCSAAGFSAMFASDIQADNCTVRTNTVGYRATGVSSIDAQGWTVSANGADSSPVTNTESADSCWIYWE